MDEENKKIEVETLKKQIDTLGNTAALMAYKSLCDLADGLYVEEPTLGGNVRRYRKEPNREAAQYIIDRNLGRPKQAIEGPGEDGAFKVEITNYGGSDNCGK